VVNINLQTAQITIDNSGNQGWQFSAYTLNGDRTAGSLYCTGVITQAYVGMPVCGRYENLFMVIYGKITAPEGVNQVSFAGYTDDGFRMYVDGLLVINQWQDQGSTWSPYHYHTFITEDRVIDVVFHYYNGGGPGVFHVGWGHSGIWTGVSPSAMSYGQGATQSQIDAYNQAVAEQQIAQSYYNEMLAIYNNKLSYYNEQNNILNAYNQTLNTKTNEYNTAVSNTATALQNKEDKEDTYNQSIIDVNDSIDAAWEYYDKQITKEIAAALAQALANQPKPEVTPEPQPSPTEQPEPTPEPTLEVEPSTKPTPEQTEPNDPNPETSSDTTDEPKPEPTPETTQTPEPSPEPSPQPTDITPDPTPEPKPTPSLPSPKPSQGNNTTEDLTNVIANLTSKDNITVKLTPEQMAAVGNTLASLSNEAKVEVANTFGIKSEEVAIIAEAAKSNAVIAAAVVEFSNRAEESADSAMPYTLADATTEIATEQFLSDPIAAFTNIDFEKVFSPSEWGKDMTDDQREKAQEVVIPVIIASNIVAAAMTRRI
jgi:hypothetical protein